GRGVPSMDQGLPIPRTQVGAHRLIPLVLLLQQHVQGFENGIGLGGHFRDARTYVFYRIALNEHGFHPSACSSFHFTTSARAIKGLWEPFRTANEYQAGL